MKCKNCGSDLVPGQIICSNCGFENYENDNHIEMMNSNNEFVSNTYNSDDYIEEDTYEENNKKQKKNGFLKVADFINGFIAVAFIIMFVMGVYSLYLINHDILFTLKGNIIFLILAIINIISISIINKYITTHEKKYKNIFLVLIVLDFVIGIMYRVYFLLFIISLIGLIIEEKNNKE